MILFFYISSLEDFYLTIGIYLHTLINILSNTKKNGGVMKVRHPLIFPLL